MSFDKIKKEIINILFLLLGAAILSFGMFNIHSRCDVTEGGVLGMTLLLKHWFGITPGISGFIMDTCCYLLGFKFLGKVFLKNAFISSFGFSVFYNIFEFMGPALPDFSDMPLAAALLGGLFVGIGVGIVVRHKGASGGDDALALVISKLTKCKLSRAYLFTDFTVLILSLSYISFERIFFSLITVTVSSFTIDIIQGFDKDKLSGLPLNESKGVN